MHLRGFAAGAFCRVSRAAPYSFGSKAISIQVPTVWTCVYGARINPGAAPGGVALTKEGLGSQPRPPPHVLHGVFQERFIPPPSPPPFIKRSQIYAMAIMICACILLPCSFGGGKVYPLALGVARYSREGAAPDQAPRGRWFLAIGAGKDLLGCGPFKKGEGRKKIRLGKAYPSRRLKPPVNKAAGRNSKAGRAALGGLFAVPSGSDDLEPDPRGSLCPLGTGPQQESQVQASHHRCIPRSSLP